MQDFKFYLDKFKNNKILVIGDLMVDKWVLCNSLRLSQEAPVPIIKVNNIRYNLGGAGNVCRNITNLGARCHFLGLLGKDNITDNIVFSFFNDINSTNSFVLDETRKNTIKERIIADGQHIVRIDNEDTNNISSEIEEKIYNKFLTNYYEFDAIILQDYNKGLLTKNLIRKIITKANEKNIKVFVDPKKDNFESYNNSYLFKPNKKEFSNIVQVDVKNIMDIYVLKDTIKNWKNSLNIKNVLITLGRQGMILFSDDEITHYDENVLENNIVDVTGAGDIVISMITLLDLNGASNYEKLFYSSVAAQISVTKRGTSLVNLQEMLKITNDRNKK